MSLLDKYRVRLKQLEGGSKELYSGETDTIRDIINILEQQ